MPSGQPGTDTDLAFRAQLSDRRAYPLAAAAAALLLTIVGIGLLPGDDGGPASGTAVPQSAAAAPSPTRAPSAQPPAATSRPRDLQPRIYPGRYDIATAQWLVHLVIPAGPGLWSATAAGAGVARHPLDATSMNVTLHDVTFVANNLCTGAPRLDAVGPTVEDLTAALAIQVGGERSGPTDVILGGYPATRLVLTAPWPSPCADQGPDGRKVWTNAGQPFYAWVGGTATIYVVDVHGERLVITSQHRGHSAEEIAELDAVVASIEIEPANVGGIARHAVTDGVELSFTAPGWESHEFYWSKSTEGSQGAEAIVFWAGFPDSAKYQPCYDLLGRSANVSTADLAATVSTVAGTDDVSGPSDVTVGGRPAKHVSFFVTYSILDNNSVCGPGFFYSWMPNMGGAFWRDTLPGDTISVWIVDVDGKLFFIEAATHWNASPDVKLEIQQIVDSIEFE
jgi:hypothetical protein